MTVLVLADVDDGRLTPATARVVAAATLLGPVDPLVDAPFFHSTKRKGRNSAFLPISF